MNFRQEIDKWGEKLACKYLEENNYKIIDRNFLYRQGKIDIITKDMIKKELVFVAVKTRSNLKYGNPADNEDKHKQEHMKKAIKYYMYKNNIQSLSIRIDVIEVDIQKSYKINHIKQIME